MPRIVWGILLVLTVVAVIGVSASVIGSQGSEQDPESTVPPLTDVPKTGAPASETPVVPDPFGEDKLFLAGRNCQGSSGTFEPCQDSCLGHPEFTVSVDGSGSTCDEAKLDAWAKARATACAICDPQPTYCAWEYPVQITCEQIGPGQWKAYFVGKTSCPTNC